MIVFLTPPLTTYEKLLAWITCAGLPTKLSGPPLGMVSQQCRVLSKRSQELPPWAVNVLLTFKLFSAPREVACTPPLPLYTE